MNFTLEADEQKIAILNQADYRFFVGIEALRRYLDEQIENGTKRVV